MTTVVLDKDLVMASDSRMCSGMEFIEPQAVDKIFHVNGHTIGVAGSYGQAYAFISFFEDMTERQRVQAGTYIPIPQQTDDNQLDNFHAIVVDPECQVFLFEGNRLSFPMQPPLAIGSGGSHAMVAMSLGQGATDAVVTAIKFDPFSGGDIQYVDHQAMLEETNSEPNVPDPDELMKLTKKQLVEKLTHTPVG